MSGAASLGLVGVGTMGRALAANLAERGHEVVVYDRDPARSRSLASEADLVSAAVDLKALAADLRRPRAVLLMVNAGKPVDAVLDALAPLLDRGDAVLDGGNSHYRDTQRRAERAGRTRHRLSRRRHLRRRGRRAPRRLDHGRRRARRVRPGGALARRPSPRASDDTPCLGWFGGAGAGHFVKMVQTASSTP